MPGWDALHWAMRAWGIRCREGLSEWVHAQGFPQPRWRAHFSGRAQERLLNAAANLDARVTVLETAYVQVTLQSGKCSRSDSQCYSLALSRFRGRRARRPNSTSRATRCRDGRGPEGDQSVEIVHSVALHVVAPILRAITSEQGRVARQI